MQAGKNMGKRSEREMTRVWPVRYLLSITLFHIHLHRPGPLHSITPVLLQSGGFMCNGQPWPGPHKDVIHTHCCIGRLAVRCFSEWESNSNPLQG